MFDYDFLGRRKDQFSHQEVSDLSGAVRRRQPLHVPLEQVQRLLRGRGRRRRQQRRRRRDGKF